MNPLTLLRLSVLTITLAAPFVFAGCASSKKQPASPRDDDTLVPEETQRRAEQNYGQQEGFMNDLSMTTSEQAGAAHERAVDRARDPKREPRNK